MPFEKPEPVPQPDVSRRRRLSVAASNHRWLLRGRPQGTLTGEEFASAEAPVPVPGDGQFLVRTVYVSVDPAMRGWISERRTYTSTVPLGAVMRAEGAGVVEASNHPGFPVGALVSGMTGWQEYALGGGPEGAGFKRLPPGATLRSALGALGGTGLTAYFGLLEIGRPQPGETVVVSGAAGATGSVAVQIAKIAGCRAVGFAGSDEKCRWLVEDLALDAAINYRTENVRQRLAETCPAGIDVFFDNVGGEILDLVLAQLAMHARVVLSGAVSRYDTAERPPGPSNYMHLVLKRARMEGFIVYDYEARFPEAEAALARWVGEGRIITAETVIHGLERAPEALQMLFSGANMGKLLVQVGDEPPTPAG